MTNTDNVSPSMTDRVNFPDQDQENFRLIRSFNDVFVALASLLVFGSAFILLGKAPEESDVWSSVSANLTLICFAIAVMAWVLAEIFTRKRSMALPSILYSTVFISMIGLATFLGTFEWIDEYALQWRAATQELQEFEAGIDSHIAAFQILQEVYSSIWLGSFLGTIAAVLFWWRFRVAISMMWLVLSGFFVVVGTILWISDEFLLDWLNGICLVFGVLVLAFAIYWDRQDVLRETHRSDVAFWLHMLAAIMLVQAFFNPFFDSGVVQKTVIDTAWIVFIYLVLGIVALALNRRAILVAALSYVVAALGWAFLSIGINAAFALLFVGVVLLCFSVWWTPIRNALLQIMPDPVLRVLKA